MLPEGAICAQHVWKRFRADRRRMLLRDEVDLLRRRLRGEISDSHRWVLREVNLQVAPGESVGLIGANGSGKSTLLKLLTRVMYPYAGRIAVQGRVGALIEVRAGIHPDLSGRENVFLYGSLLGLPRREVAERFDAIVDFAEMPEAIDRQVKFYSSGMQMRLGFAVAAFLEPSVLLVDEVLAVGDAAFQQKCLNRMRAVLAEGTTLVFVSHDLAAVEATCQRGVWLDAGRIRIDGPVRQVLSSYRDAIEAQAASGQSPQGVIRLVSCRIHGEGRRAVRTGGQLAIEVTVETEKRTPANFFFGVSDGPAAPIFVLRRDQHLAVGQTQVRCAVEHLPLPRGRYFLWLGVFDKRRDLLPWHPAGRFDVAGPDLQDAPRAIPRLAPIHVQTSWEVARV